MSKTLPIITLARHGETEWSLAGRHTGRTDKPLTERGEEMARGLAARLKDARPAKVFTSPLVRAARTCELAGFGAEAELDDGLLEWDYGAYEGLTSAQILAQRPDWQLFRDGCPGGESPADIAARADGMVARIRAVNGPVLLFSSAHLLRVLTARWLGEPVTTGRFFVLGTASLSTLGYDHNLAEPVVRSWNG